MHTGAHERDRSNVWFARRCAPSSSSSGHPYVSIYGNISASVFMHTRVRVIAGTRVFTRREIKYANLRAWASLLASVSDRGDIFERGTGTHGRICGSVNCLANNEFPSIFRFESPSLSLFSSGKKEKRILRMMERNWISKEKKNRSRSFDKYRQMGGSYRLGEITVEENTRF